MNYRLKLLAFFLGALGVLGILNVASSALNTISRLDFVEAERDRWQRPSAALQALDVKPGDTVVDLGCGSGYFTLKLSALVGARGDVVAEDIRRESLTFLWIRTLFRNQWNVRVLRGALDNPRLPPHVNAVLISNTYHELADSHAILAHVYQSLVRKGRLVIVDRAPHTALAASPRVDHEISADRAAGELRHANFAIVSRQDHFIDRDPGGESWWMIAACKP